MCTWDCWSITCATRAPRRMIIYRVGSCLYSTIQCRTQPSNVQSICTNRIDNACPAANLTRCMRKASSLRFFHSQTLLPAFLVLCLALPPRTQLLPLSAVCHSPHHTSPSLPSSSTRLQLPPSSVFKGSLSPSPDFSFLSFLFFLRSSAEQAYLLLPHLPNFLRHYFSYTSPPVFTLTLALLCPRLPQQQRKPTVHHHISLPRVQSSRFCPRRTRYSSSQLKSF